ncbi:MAG TPA: anaerobic ribonucleoside-triphosphate reductase [Candidatus Bathyarchaeia archaeon]|nr:anaerobic ribonucleoside-triphosphate reductase [Candidatus Bathyarchaeia archaeon]
MEQAKIEQNITKITEIESEFEDEKNIEMGKACSPNCAYCHSDNVYGMSRVVGYFSVIENWNKSKKEELKRRQEGNYWTDKV